MCDLQETLAADPTFIASNFLNFLKGIQVVVVVVVVVVVMVVEEVEVVVVVEEVVVVVVVVVVVISFNAIQSGEFEEEEVQQGEGVTMYERQDGYSGAGTVQELEHAWDR